MSRKDKGVSLLKWVGGKYILAWGNSKCKNPEDKESSLEVLKEIHDV